MSVKYWTTKEEAYMRERYLLDGAAAVGAVLGRSANAVWHRARIMGLAEKAQPPTLQNLKARCDVIGKCWLWQGAIDRNGQAKMRYQNKSAPVRRVVRSIKDKAPIPPDMKVSATCGNVNCVSPHCSVVVTQSEAFKMAAARGVYSSAMKHAKIAATRRARSRFTEEIIQLVRDHPGAHREAAELAGMSRQHAAAIRRGLAWKTTSPLGVAQLERLSR